MKKGRGRLYKTPKDRQGGNVTDIKTIQTNVFDNLSKAMTLKRISPNNQNFTKNYNPRDKKAAQNLGKNSEIKLIIQNSLSSSQKR